MREWVKRRSEDFACVFVLIAAAVCSLAPVVFTGHVPVDTRPLGDLIPWASDPDAILDDVTSLNPDLRYHIPNYAFIVRAQTEGHTVLWNPLENGGAPFLAQWRTRVYSPFTLPFYVFGLHTALGLSVFLKIVCAGGTAFYAARRLGIGPPFALLAALSFQLGAHMSLYGTTPLTDTLVWFPLFFVFLERLALHHFGHWATGSAVIALMILGGSPETLLGTMFVGTTYLGVRLYYRRGEVTARPAFVGLGATLLFATILCAVVLVPFVQFRLNATLVEPLRDIPPLAVVHLGIVNVLLAGLWLSMRQHIALAHRHRVDSTLFAASLVLILALPLAPLLARIPIVGALETHHLLAGLSFVVAIGAAAAGEAWLELNPAQCRSVLKRLTLMVPVLLLPAVLLSLLPFGLSGSPSDFRVQLIFTGIIAAVFSGVFGFTLFRPSARLMGYGLALITAAELLGAFWAIRPLSDGESLFAETGTVVGLQKARLVGGGETIAQWPLSAHGIAQLRGAGPYAHPDYLSWLSSSVHDQSLLLQAPSDIHFYSSEELYPGLLSARHKFEMRSAHPSGVLGLAYPEVLSQFRLVRDALPTDGLGSTEVGTIEKIEDVGSRQVFRVVNLDAERFGFWGASFPGWRAYLNDVETPIDRSQSPFNTIAMPQGEHNVRLEYRPETYIYGRWITRVALVVLALGFLNLARERIALRRTR